MTTKSNAQIVSLSLAAVRGDIQSEQAQKDLEQAIFKAGRKDLPEMLDTYKQVSCVAYGLIKLGQRVTAKTKFAELFTQALEIEQKKKTDATDDEKEQAKALIELYNEYAKTVNNRVNTWTKRNKIAALKSDESVRMQKSGAKITKKIASAGKSRTVRPSATAGKATPPAHNGKQPASEPASDSRSAAQIWIENAEQLTTMANNLLTAGDLELAEVEQLVANLAGLVAKHGKAKPASKPAAKKSA